MINSRDAQQVALHSGSALTSLGSALRHINPPRLIAVAIQLALLVYLAKVFRLESPAFQKVLTLATAGFVIHHALPMAMRLPFFVLLSLGSLALVLGLPHTARLVGVGVALIALCHLPINFYIRLVLIAAAATALVLGRADLWFPIPGYQALWPILGSMFMFRLIIYLYDLKNHSAPFSLWRSLAYFFMLPNVCFPMYPVVDYQAFNRHYYDESPWRMYQVGIKWIFRGMLHLLLYRFISNNLLIEAQSVTDAASLARYMVTTYSLYLLISGQFHVIVGMLHLFGFNLPETHHLYYLSSSFTDFWRRINIYWKDFILKIFFNPMYFRCKKLGPAAAMSIATLYAFFFTWLLHSYQWFWIRGTYPTTWQDAVFWGALALLVLVNALYEQKHGRNRKLKGAKWSIADRALIGLKTIGTFSVIVTLWCLWTFQGTFSEWLTFMGNFRNIDTQTAFWIVAGLAGLGIISALLASVGREYSAGAKPRLKSTQPLPVDNFPFWRSVALSLVILIAVVFIGRFNNRIPYSPVIKAAVGDLRLEISTLDRAERDQGYYEDLTNTKNYNLALWELYHQKPTGVERLDETALGLEVPDQFHQFELVPSMQITFRGLHHSTNRWGMRDRDYEKLKPHGTFRVVMLGSSITMGWGVADGQPYESALEDRLNRELAGTTHDRFEILNFAVGGYKPFQKFWAFHRALEFQPDAVIWEAHASELNWVIHHLARIVQSRVPIPYPQLQQMLEAEGLNNQTGGLVVQTKLKQMSPQLLLWIWQQMKQQCDQRGIELQILLIPRLDFFRDDQALLANLADMALKAGLPILDLTAAYDESGRKGLRVAMWDDHPNARGHQLLADELYKQMLLQDYWRNIFGSPTSDTLDSPHELAD